MIKPIKLFLSLAAFFLAGRLLAQAHVIITAGQSNTDGRVPVKDLPDYIKKLSTDPVNFKTGAYKYCKIDQNREDGKFLPFYPKGRITPGLWAYDAVTYYKLEQALQQDFYVIKYAVGGTSIQYPKNIPPKGKGRYWSATPAFIDSTTSFETGGHSLLLSFTDAIDASIDNTLSKLKDGYQIDAFLWHQGESDGTHATQYYDNLKVLIAYVRKHLTEKTGKDYSKLPFIFGSIPTTNRDYSPIVEVAMKRIAGEDPNAYLVDMSEGQLQKDHLHFTATSAEYLGTEMYGILAKIMHLNKVGFRVARYLGNKQAAISFTFDDGLAEQATLVAPHFNQLGMKATFFVNGMSISDSTVNGGKPRMSWDALRTMAKHGHEISNHGWQHRNLGKFPLDEIKTDIDKNDSVIYAELGVKPLTFAYANNMKKADGMVEVYKHHIASRLLQISLGGKRTATDLESRLKQLLKCHGWLVTMTHGITYGYDHFTDPNILWNYLKRVKRLEDKIWVGTFYQVAAYTREEKGVTFDIQQSKGGFTVMPTLHLDKALYTGPLTGLVAKKGLKILSVMQSGQKLKTREVGGEYQFDFNPFGGLITIKTH